MEVFQRALHSLDATELYQKKVKTVTQGSREITTKTCKEKKKVNVTCMGSMFGQKESKK